MCLLVPILVAVLLTQAHAIPIDSNGNIPESYLANKENVVTLKIDETESEDPEVKGKFFNWNTGGYPYRSPYSSGYNRPTYNTNRGYNTGQYGGNSVWPSTSNSYSPYQSPRANNNNQWGGSAGGWNPWRTSSWPSSSNYSPYNYQAARQIPSKINYDDRSLKMEKVLVADSATAIVQPHNAKSLEDAASDSSPDAEYFLQFDSSVPTKKLVDPYSVVHAGKPVDSLSKSSSKEWDVGKVGQTSKKVLEGRDNDNTNSATKAQKLLTGKVNTKNDLV